MTQSDQRAAEVVAHDRESRQHMPLLGSAAYFDEVATEYFPRYHAHSPGGYALRVRQRRALELLGRAAPGAKVLDVGCGPGVLMEHLLDLGYEFWGVDASPAMIEQCQKRFGNVDRAHFQTGDATNLALPNESFDAVICLGVIDGIRKYESAIKEMVRVVKANGTLLISFANLISPYAAWRKFVYYPTVALLRPVYYGLAGRPNPPSQLSSLTNTRLHTPHSVAELMAGQGANVTDVVHFYFNVFLSPLDELFPRWALRTTKKLERLRLSKLKWLGAGFIVRAKKLA